MNVKLNDNVLVIAGKDKGKTGRVVSTSPKAGRVIEQDGKMKKVRVCKCGNVLDKTYKKQAKAAEKKAEEAPKKRTRKRTAKAEAAAEEKKD